MSPPTVERVRVGNLELCLRRFEPRRRAEVTAPETTALLLHGFMDAGATWDEVAARLADAGLTVFAPDLRGFGESDRVGAGGYYHFADYVLDVSRLVDHLDPARLFLVGHSMGGTVASLFAGARPERVAALALLEGLGALARESTFAVDKMRAWLRDMAKLDRAARPMASLDEATERLAMTHPRISEDVLRRRAEQLTRRDADGNLVWAFDPLHRTTSPTPFRADAYVAFLRSITCPTLFVSGGPHGWHPPDEDERLAAIPDLRRRELADAGHMLHWTAPDRLADTLLTFHAECFPT